MEHCAAVWAGLRQRAELEATFNLQHSKSVESDLT